MGTPDRQARPLRMNLIDRLVALCFEASGLVFWMADAFVVLMVASALDMRLAGLARGSARTVLSVGILSLAIVKVSAAAYGH